MVEEEEGRAAVGSCLQEVTAVRCWRGLHKRGSFRLCGSQSTVYLEGQTPREPSETWNLALKKQQQLSLMRRCPISVWHYLTIVSWSLLATGAACKRLLSLRQHKATMSVVRLKHQPRSSGKGSRLNQHNFWSSTHLHSTCWESTYMKYTKRRLIWINVQVCPLFSLVFAEEFSAETP